MYIHIQRVLVTRKKQSYSEGRLLLNNPKNAGVITVLLTPSNYIYRVLLITMSRITRSIITFNVSVANSTFNSWKFKFSVSRIFGREDTPTSDTFFKTISWILLLIFCCLPAGNTTKEWSLNLWPLIFSNLLSYADDRFFNS